MHNHRFPRAMPRLAPAGRLLLSSLVLWAAGTAGANAASLLTNGALNTGPQTAYVCVWVYLLQGVVGVGVGNGGNTNGNDMVLHKTGSWEMLQVSNGHTPVNQVFIASLTGGAEYYVESARVDTTRVNCKPK